ncbi:MAG: TolC family outer membrane protein [Xanthomonadales bacterium]|jgi:outer membrane protein|nr:TolC family outer membrane protein [Xanthomonadales bacterium]
MSVKSKLIGLAGAGLLLSSPAGAVDLVGVHDLALNYDPTLQAADFRRQAAYENKSIARANMLPQLGASGNWRWGSTETSVPGINLEDQDIETTSYGIDLAQSLYRQANYESLDIARGQISQAEAVYQATYQDFLLRVSTSYFTVLTLIDGVTFAEAEEKAFKRQFEQAEQRFEVGLTAVTDVHEARATYDNARARAIVARNNLEDAKEALFEITGQSFETFDALQENLPLVEPNPDNAEQWVQMALRSNPLVLSAQAAVDIADSNMRLARSGHLPTLDLVAGWNQFTNKQFVYRDFVNNIELITDLESTDTTFGLILDVPIYEGGRVSARTRQARYLLDATGQDLDATNNAIVRETENAYRAVLAGIQEVEAFRQASISAESALEATQAGFEVGTRTIVDVLIAEQRKYQAQRDNSIARHAYILRHLQLKGVAGLLTAEDLVVVNQLLQ